jgi:5-methylcytosine-specific restriction endonuclease McrA
MHENRKWMIAVKERDIRCKHCEGIKELEVHHIISLAIILEKYNITNRNEARNCKELWDISNGITLCRKCHYKLENRKYNDNN